ncbi:MAG: sigma-54 dependent transcriptional regulator [Gemmatimonadota bacterium]|jgi:DNA-binding NtrC family response regulator
MRDTLLIIEDEDLLRAELARHYSKSGWEVVEADTASAATRLLSSRSVQPVVVLCDLSLPDGDGLDLLERHHGASGAEWIILTGYGSVPDSVRALRLGAFDFVEKPCPTERLDLVITGAARSARAQRRLRTQSDDLHERYSLDAFIGESRAADEVRSTIEQLSQVPLSCVLIGGETGVGKGLVARILHYNGPRREGPLVEVNCAALPSELLESELYGHEAGAFTGAKSRHRGLFEQAHGGTLFLDEISELDGRLQAKLLRAVEDGRIRRVGGEAEIEVDVQLFAASNRDLGERVREGEFREDLLHRLSVFVVKLPPLRERPEDIEPLVMQLIAEFNARSGKEVKVVSQAAWSRLRAYDWPGNVRELRNVVERSVLLSTGAQFPETWLPGEGTSSAVGSDRDDDRVLRFVLDGKETLDQWESRILAAALEQTEGNVTAAARLLGVSRQTLRYRLEKYGIGGED